MELKELLFNINNIVKQERTYVSSVDEAPEGVNVQRGRRGGLFFTGAGEKNQQEQPTSKGPYFNVTSVKDLEKSIPKFKTNISEIFNQLPNWHVQGTEFYLVKKEDLTDPNDNEKGFVVGQYDWTSRTISISSIANNIDLSQDEYGETINVEKKSVWKLVVIHELGHRVMDDPGVKKKYKKMIQNEDDSTLGSPSKFGCTKYAKSNQVERFAEAYLYYLQNPRFLESTDKSMFDFLKSDVFDEQEYSEALIKQQEDSNIPEGSYWMEDYEYLKKLISDSDNQKNPDSISKAQVHPSIKYSGHYIPIRTIIRSKNGLIRSAIRWKKFASAGLEKIKSNKNLKGVVHVSQTPTYTQQSLVKQTLFFVSDEASVAEIKNDNYIPLAEYKTLGLGIYLHGDIDEATKKSEEEEKEVLPVKVNLQKLFQSTMKDVESQNIEGLKEQGYDAIVLMKEGPYQFDLFVFDNSKIVVIGDDELSDKIAKDISETECEDCLDAKDFSFNSFMPGIIDKIEKAVIATPSNPDGSVAYDKVPIGSAIWVTVTKEGPLHGRHVLITKRPDGLFAITGGAGHRQMKDKYGLETRTDALRHLVMAGKPEKTKADVELDKINEERQKENEPLIERRRELAKYGKEEIEQAFNKFNDAVQIKSMDATQVRKHREEISKYAQDNGLDEEKADDYASAIVRHYSMAEKQIAEKRRRDVGLNLYNKLRKMKEGSNIEEVTRELNEELDFRPISVDLPNPESYKDLTKEDIDGKIGDIINEKVAEIFNPNPLDKRIDSELKTEGIELSDTEKSKDIMSINLGETIKPLEIKDEESLKSSFEKFKSYYALKKEINEVKKLIKPADLKKVTPALLEKMRMDIKGIFREGISDEELMEIQTSYDEQWQNNNSALSFYKAISDIWNDKKSIKEKLSRIDNGFGGYVNSGANSALSALTGKYVGERTDAAQLIDKTNIETASMITAFQLRDKFKGNVEQFNSIIQKVEEFNNTNQIKTEQEALSRHKDLQSKYQTIQSAKQTGTLSSKLFSTESEINNLIEQKKNLGTALGSMQASAAFLNALQIARDAKDNMISVDFGNDSNGAESRLLELNLGNKGFIDASDPNHVKLLTSAKALNKYVKSLDVIKENHDENERIKTNMNGVFEDEEGKVYVKDYKVPMWKDTYKDEEGKEQKYQHRIEQRNDIEFLKKTGNGVITRVTGAGKTNVALGFFANKIDETKNYSGLTIVPKGRVKQWVEEAKKFSNLDVVEIPEGINKDERAKMIAGLKKNQIAVMSQKDAIVSYYPLEGAFMSGQIKGMVLDEPQEIASRSISGNMSASIRKLTKLPSENRIVLTATPARDNLIEAYDLVNWVSHHDKSLGPRIRFQRIYGGYGSGTNAQDTTLQQMIFKEISPYISGDRLTNPNFKIKRNNISVKKTDIQNTNMKKLEANADKYIEDEKITFLNNISNNPEELKKWENKYGRAWKTQASLQSNKVARQKLLEDHGDNLDGISGQMTWKDNPKISGFINNFTAEKNKKHVVFLDNDKQRRAIVEGLSSTGLKQNQIKNIASSTISGGIKGSEMSNRVKEFKTDKNVKVIFIDKNSSSGYNLQEGDVLQVLGTPSDAASYLQAQGRVARMPRKGDVEINTYKYSDNPFDDEKWTKLDHQTKILQATSPGLFVEGKGVKRNE